MKKIQDKYNQKNVFKSNNIPLPKYDKIDTLNDLKEFGKQYGYPFIAKTRTLGYDGYGNYTILSEDDCSIA